MFSDTFVIFGFRQDFVVPSVCQHEYGTFDSAEEFLDDHRRGGRAEHAAQHFFQFLAGFFQCRQDEHAFAEDKLPDAFKIIGFERYVFPHTARTRISGCDVQLVYFLALGDFPGQSVFAPSAA